MILRICTLRRHLGQGLLLWLLWSPLWAETFDNGMLFRITGPHSTTPSYLLGTIHSDDPEVLALPGPVQQALKNTSTFIMEIVPNTQAAMTAMMYPEGHSLKETLRPDLYHATVRELATLGIQEPVAQRFRPWAAVAMLSVPPNQSGLVLDITLFQEAVAQGKRVFGLETVEEQFSAFAAIPDAEQTLLLRETLNMRPHFPQLFRMIRDAYLQRNLRQLMTLYDKLLKMGDEPWVREFNDQLLIKRNRHMLERMKKSIDQGGTFVAVGAFHLGGPDGLLERLIAAGYRVEVAG